MKKVGIIYGSTTGNTENVANAIKNEIGSGELINVSEVQKSTFEDYDILILGTSTWGIGDIQDDWSAALSFLEQSNLKNKKVAIFGLGDKEGYPDSFVDGMFDIYESAVKAGAKIIGQTTLGNYEFSRSRAVVDGIFVGLPIDEDNESEKTDTRLKTWLSAIINEINN